MSAPHVGDRGKSGVVVLNVSFVEFDPTETSCRRPHSFLTPLRRFSSVLCFVAFWVEIGLGVVMNMVLALAGALLLSLICEKAEAQVAREAFYSIPSET